MPSARDHLGCGVIDGLFVVAGGAYWEHEAKHFGQGTIAYSPTQGRWITLPDLPTPGAYGASAVIDNQLFIAGGADSTGALTKCIRLRRVDGRLRWESLPDLPRPIWGASGAAAGSKFYVFGGAPGMDVDGMKAARPSLLVLDMSMVVPRWMEEVGPGMPAGRVGAATAVVGTKIYVFGGYGLQADGELGNFGDAFVLDTAPKIRTWKRIKNPPVAARWSAAQPVILSAAKNLASPQEILRSAQNDNPAADPEVPRYIMIAGGYGEAFLDKVWLYDTKADNYIPYPGLPLPACTMASGVGSDGTVYMAGGEDAMRHRSASFTIGRVLEP